METNSWHKDCECKGAASTGQFRCEETGRGKDYINMAVNYYQVPSCDFCGKPFTKQPKNLAHRQIDMSEERSAGMYEVADPSYPQVKVGKYTICRHDERSVWIQTDDGEGGQFSDDAFFAAVDAFYRANF